MIPELGGGRASGRMAQVRKLWIPGPAGRLEAALRVADAARATAVVAHPHPLHGGTMHNPVVFRADRQLHRLGLTTLRFNFRGTGDSQGEHDNGRGEVEDLCSAASWVRGLAPRVPLIVVGYSFGAWCCVRLAERDHSIRALIGIGLPVRTQAFDEIARLGRPLAVVQGSDDELGSPGEVRRLLDRAKPKGRLFVVDGASHLFANCAKVAASRVEQAARATLDALQISHRNNGV